MSPELRERLLELRRRDEVTRERLMASGRLSDGYAGEMERVHLRNAAALEAALERGGWPKVSQVGEEASEAAWLVAQHAISRPDFQRRCLRLLCEAVESGEAPARHRAMLLDRIRFNERRPQVYGTILDWDESGELSPWPIEDPESVDELRRRVGLPPLCDSVERSRLAAAREGESAPKDPVGRREAIDRWARKVGWR